MGVSFGGWLLSLHVLSAFAVVAGLTMLLIALAAGRRPAPSESAPLLRRMVDVGATALRGGLVGTMVLGVWLVLRQSYSIWDGWILGSLILWLVVGGLGDRSVAQFRRAVSGDSGPAGAGGGGGRGGGERLPVALHSQSLFWLRLAAFVAGCAILGLMIWKPGA